MEEEEEKREQGTGSNGSVNQMGAVPDQFYKYVMFSPPSSFLDKLSYQRTSVWARIESRYLYRRR